MTKIIDILIFKLALSKSKISKRLAERRRRNALIKHLVIKLSKKDRLLYSSTTHTDWSFREAKYMCINLDIPFYIEIDSRANSSKIYLKS